MEIILKEFGDLSKSKQTTDTAATKQMRADAANIAKQKGITAAERGVISDFIKTLNLYAEKYNIKSGNIFALLSKINDAMLKKIKEDPKQSQIEPEQ